MEQDPSTPDVAQASQLVSPPSPPPVAGRRRIGLVAGLTASLGLAVLGGLVASQRLQAPANLDIAATPVPEPETTVAEASPAEPENVAEAPAPDLRAEAPAADPENDVPERWQSALLEAPPTEPAAEPAPATPEAAPVPEATPPAQVQIVPLPMPRPPELGGPVQPRRALRQTPRRTRAAEAPAPVEDTRSFFDKLFGIERPANPPSPALAYASLETPQSLPRAVPAPAPPVAPPNAGGGTAIYDISARTVTLPSGEKLEAHSGLGTAMDDPRYVHMPMRGPTPPGAYDLTEREQVFHGVRAIRMTPIGGSGAIYGRVGILAHTYMLGPSGASNGCVAFRDYDKFLQAYLRGEINRLVVVAGNGNTGPNLVSRLFGANR